MKVKSRSLWTGKIIITKKNVKTGNVVKRLVYNRLMDNALNEIIKAFYYANGSNMYLKHVAIGDDNTANSDDLESLYNEIYRVPIVNRLKTGTGKIESRGILLDTEPSDLSGECDIKEIGFFAGDSSLNWNSGAGKDTGLMISRVVITTEEKTDNEQINFTRVDEFARG
jgi:hypothetical protein